MPVSIPTHLRRRLTPEEDSVGDPDDEEDGVDDTLPADLWFRCGCRAGSRCRGGDAV